MFSFASTAGRRSSRSSASGKPPLRKRRTAAPAAFRFEAIEPRLMLSAASLDPSFDGDGMALFDLNGSFDQAHAVAQTADGKLLVAGYMTFNGGHDFGLMRLNPDGSLDASFGNGGVSRADLGSNADAAFAMAVGPDGKIVLAGRTFIEGRGFDFAVARFTASGILDDSFGFHGVMKTDFALGSDQANAVVILPDGKILVAGTAIVSNNSQYAMVRYDADGNLDTRFGSGGKLLTPFAGVEAEARSMALMADGRIVLGGLGFSWSDFSLNFTAARYLPSGALDTSFNGTGRAVISVGGWGQANDLAVMADGSMVLAGTAGGDFALVKLTAAGALDGAFGSGGLVVADFGGTDEAQSVVLLPDGGIAALGGTGDNWAMLLLNANGSPKTNLAPGSVLVTDMGSADESALHAMLSGDGRLVAVGYAHGGATQHDWAVARYVFGAAQPVNAAPVANAGGPYSLAEGHSVQVSGAGSSDADGAIVSWEWDFDYDGTNFDVDATGITPTFSAADLDGPTMRTIALRVTDDKGASHVAATTVNVTNAAPSVSIQGPASTMPNQPVTLVASISDVPMDTHMVMWDFGDGTSSGWVAASDPGALSVSVAYKGVRTMTITLTVMDDDGAMAVATHTLSVTPPHRPQNPANPKKNGAADEPATVPPGRSNSAFNADTPIVDPGPSGEDVLTALGVKKPAKL